MMAHGDSLGSSATLMRESRKRKNSIILFYPFLRTLR